MYRSLSQINNKIQILPCSLLNLSKTSTCEHAKNSNVCKGQHWSFWVTGIRIYWKEFTRWDSKNLQRFKRGLYLSSCKTREHFSSLQTSELTYSSHLQTSPRNMIGQSQSGTGKTAAFALTMLSRVDMDLKAPQVRHSIPSFPCPSFWSILSPLGHLYCPVPRIGHSNSRSRTKNGWIHSGRMLLRW